MIHITIDGPSGAGKSTVAKAVAEKLNIIYLDTGAIYRAFAYAAIKDGIDVNDGVAVEKFLENADIEVKYPAENPVGDLNAKENADGSGKVREKEVGDYGEKEGAEEIRVRQRVFCNKTDATDFIREHGISKAASDISKHIPVRIRLSEIQRKIASEHDVVLDGRDAGTFVLPDANFKFFLTADVGERAERRYAELKEKGGEVTLERVLEDIKLRDFNDSNRSFAPLKRARDARFIDSTHMNAEEVAELIIGYITGSDRKRKEKEQNGSSTRDL
jgi:cytidylate kinase